MRTATRTVRWGLWAPIALALLGSLLLIPRTVSHLKRAFWVWRADAIGGEFLGWESTTRQVGDWDCGVAVASMMLARFGRDTTGLAPLRARVLAKREPMSVLEIRDAMRRAGLASYGVRADAPALESLPKPAVAYLPGGLGHFVIVDSIAGDAVYVRDPARGALRFSQQSFARVWKGILLVPGTGSSG